MQATSLLLQAVQADFRVPISVSEKNMAAVDSRTTTQWSENELKNTSNSFLDDEGAPVVINNPLFQADIQPGLVRNRSARFSQQSQPTFYPRSSISKEVDMVKMQPTVEPLIGFEDNANNSMQVDLPRATSVDEEKAMDQDHQQETIRAKMSSQKKISTGLLCLIPSLFYLIAITSPFGFQIKYIISGIGEGSTDVGIYYSRKANAVDGGSTVEPWDCYVGSSDDCNWYRSQQAFTLFALLLSITGALFFGFQRY